MERLYKPTFHLAVIKAARDSAEAQATCAEWEPTLGGPTLEERDGGARTWSWVRASRWEGLGDSLLSTGPPHPALRPPDRVAAASKG